MNSRAASPVLPALLVTLGVPLALALLRVATATPNNPLQIGDIGLVVFWSSFLAAPLLALLGLWHRSPWVLALGALVAAPFALLLSAYPNTRYFVVLPLFHLLGAPASRAQWRGALPLLVFAALSFYLLFLAIRFADLL